MHGFEQRRPRALRVEVGRRCEPDAAGDGTGEVGEDVAEQVVGDDDVIAVRVLDKNDAGGVDVVVSGGHLGVLRGRPSRTPSATGRPSR